MSVLLTTPRYSLSFLSQGDDADLFTVYGNPVVVRFVDDGEPLPQADAARWLEVTQNNYRKYGYGMFKICERESGRLVGFIGLVHPGGQVLPEVKYALLSEFWGQGAAKEVVSALVRYGHSELGLNTIIATIDIANTASQKVIIAAGFRQVHLYSEDDGLTAVYLSGEPNDVRAIFRDQSGQRTELVSAWFGDDFLELHPMIQALHLYGGRLTGKVTLGFSNGVRGWFTRRVAQKMGLPITSGLWDFSVSIHHGDDRMVWTRRFSKTQHNGTNRYEVVSEFTPIESRDSPAGGWCETSGALGLALTVDVKDGAWHWRTLDTKYLGISLPNWLTPNVTAYKQIQDERYQFSVDIGLPFSMGHITYSGKLEVDYTDVMNPPPPIPVK